MDRPIQYDSNFRGELERLATDVDPREFSVNLPAGITLVKPPFSGVDCEEYAIGTKGLRDLIVILYPRLDSLEEGDLVLYGSESETAHMGRLQEDGLVESKWGKEGPVLRHPIDMVPNRYGDLVYFRRIPEEDLSYIREHFLDIIGKGYVILKINPPLKPRAFSGQ